ncbi:hypothetical protein SAMN03097699_0243 [Flavobacteriaceae bacterium MAR_2010_188]|nr:hypothetical protein SAMN03097699_0243 [Flavobacteriaceae bacterium MAR_2010_188]
MKNTIYTFIVSFLTFTMSAQEMSREERHEQIKELKIAFITERLDLTTAEAEKFWPIYNEFESSYNEFRKESHRKRKSSDLKNLSEKQAKDLLEEMTSIEDQKYSLKSKFVKDLQKIIPAKKIVLLRKAEDDFNRKMIEEFKRRRQEKEKRP